MSLYVLQSLSQDVTDFCFGLQSTIKLGLKDKLPLGNMESMRDWGHAKDYVKAMHLMLQSENPEDYVIASEKSTTLKEFVKKTLREMDDTDNFSEDDFDACFKEFDKDGNGTIEKCEMALFIKKVAGLTID